MNLRQQIILTVAAYPPLIYALAYVQVCLKPYWYDNKPYPEYIPQSERWGFALLISFYWIFMGLPLLFGAIVLISYLHNRQNRPPR